MKKTKAKTKKINPTAQTLKRHKHESTPLKYFKDENGEKVRLVGSHPGEDASENAIDDLANTRLKEIVGVKDTELANSIFYRASRALEVPHPDQNENIVLQTLHNLKPKDVIESRLIVQETVLHSELMKVLYFLSDSENAWGAELYLNMLTKLTRLHNETVETLSRYRRGGAQTVNVQHAIVDNRAVVNNFGVGGIIENKGDKPCIESAELKREPTTIDHAVCPQWLTGVVGSTGESAAAPQRKREEKS